MISSGIHQWIRVRIPVSPLFVVGLAKQSPTCAQVAEDEVLRWESLCPHFGRLPNPCAMHGIPSEAMRNDYVVGLNEVNIPLEYGCGICYTQSDFLFLETKVWGTTSPFGRKSPSS